MRCNSMMLAVTALTATSLPLAAHETGQPNEDALVLGPVSDWAIAKDPNSCLLERKFAHGESEFTLQIEKYNKGAQFLLRISGPRIRLAKGKSELSYRFLPDIAFLTKETALMGKASNGLYVISFEATLDVSRAFTEIGEQGQREVMMQPDEVDFKRELAITALELAAPLEQPMTFMTGEMFGPMRALDSCLDAVAPNRNSDPFARAAVLKGDPKIEYPLWMIRRGASARLFVGVAVDGKGRVTNCTIKNQDRLEGDVQSICSQIKRNWIFEPAVDRDGKPVSSKYNTVLTFMLNR